MESRIGYDTKRSDGDAQGSHRSYLSMMDWRESSTRRQSSAAIVCVHQCHEICIDAGFLCFQVAR